VLEEFDLSQYEDVLLGLESKENAELDRDAMDPDAEAEVVETPGAEQPVAISEPREPIPMLEQEQPEPTQAPPQGGNMLQRLMQRIRGN